MAAWGRLRVLDGAHEGTVFVLEREVHTLGRGQASDFRLADPTVSRVQAEFRATPDGIRIAGLSDKNPVWVNGEPAGRGRAIIFGDKVQCGLVHLVFEDLPAPAPAPKSEGPATRGLAMTTGGLSSIENIPAAPAAGGAGSAAPKGPSCARCGAREAPGARYCGTCGAALGGAVPMPVTSVTRVPFVDPALAAATITPVAPTPMGPLRTDTQSNASPLPLPVRTDTMARPPEGFEGLDALPGSRGRLLPVAGSVLKGRFELRRHIAHGRVTEVYEAFDRVTKAPVTVKALLPSLAADLEVRDWFFHAANALIVAAHPSLLRVHSVHESGATCFAVTDFLYGVPLRDQIRSRPASMGGYDPAEVRRVGTALCEALGKLHEVGPHGDVVPGNVWIDPQGKVTLLDAGLSAVPGKAVRWPPSSDLASAVYSAPEVLRGAPPDARSDLYSVGAILYHMLTADLPAGRIPPVAQARPGLPPDLSGAVDRAMSPRPQDRFASANEMLRFLTGELETGRRTRLKKRYIAAAAAGVLLLVGASSVYWHPPAEAWRRRSFVDTAAVTRADGVKAEALAAEAALAPLSEFASAPALEAAREAIRRGDAAKADWLPAKAEEEYSAARQALRQEEAKAGAKKARSLEVVGGAERAVRDLEQEIARVAPAGEFLRAAMEEYRGRAAAAAPAAESGTVGAGLEALERRASLEETAGRAEALHREWTKFSAEDEAVRRAAAEPAGLRALLAEGRPEEAAKRGREGVLLLRRAMGEELEFLLKGLCMEARIPRPAEFEEAKAALAGVHHEAAVGDGGGASAAFERTLSTFAGAFGRALESVRASVEAREAARRCRECGGEGKCGTCRGSGRSEANCPTCEGRGQVPAPCADCAGSKKVPCAGCAGKGEVPDLCPDCGGRKWVTCADCKGAPKACDFKDCDHGTVTCYNCKGTGQETVAGTKKKPCTFPGCAKGRIPCRACAGKGIVDCPTCHGDPHPPCKACGGTGGKSKACPKCAGSKLQECARCSGTGKASVPCPDRCAEGKVISPCRACDGGGSCPVCKGRGRKE